MIVRGGCAPTAAASLSRPPPLRRREEHNGNRPRRPRGAHPLGIVQAVTDSAKVSTRGPGRPSTSATKTGSPVSTIGCQAGPPARLAHPESRPRQAGRTCP